MFLHVVKSICSRYFWCCIMSNNASTACTSHLVAWTIQLASINVPHTCASGTKPLITMLFAVQIDGNFTMNNAYVVLSPDIIHTSPGSLLLKLTCIDQKRVNLKGPLYRSPHSITLVNFNTSPTLAFIHMWSAMFFLYTIKPLKCPG